MRVRVAHTSAIDGHRPGDVFEVDPDHAAWAPLLKGGLLVPAAAVDVRFGPNDPPPSQEAVRELVAGVSARDREIAALREDADRLQRERDEAGDAARALQQRVTELEALLGQRSAESERAAALQQRVTELEAQVASLTSDLSAATAPKGEDAKGRARAKE